MRILDTHLHLVDTARFAYPWLATAPKLNRSWSAEEYFAEALPLGIESALHMEAAVPPEQGMDEARFAARAHPRIVGVVAACNPESPTFADELAFISQDRSIRGVRRGLNVLPPDMILSETFTANVGRLAALNLPFDLCVTARQLRAGTRLVEACPSVQFVLDHCGMPDMVAGNRKEWQDDIAAIARLPNIVAKVSGIIAYAGPTWSLDDLKPYFLHLVETFGWDRLVWGSDYPVCNLHAGLGAWVAVSRELAAAAGATAAQEQALFHANAARIYRI